MYSQHFPFNYDIFANNSQNDVYLSRTQRRLITTTCKDAIKFTKYVFVLLFNPEIGHAL
jgi:hypothetical protein